MLSAEGFILKNLLMNIIVMSVSARCIGHIRWHRVTAAAVTGTAYAFAAYSWCGGTWMRSLWAQILCMVLLAVILFGHRFRGYAVLVLIGSLIFSGGIMTVLSLWLKGGMLMLTGWICIAALVFIGDRVKADEQNVQSHVAVRIGTRMGSVTLQTLVDTGNRLTEPLSGLPVLIAEAEALERIVDSSCLYSASRRLPPGFRLVRYGVLGGEGEMRCFRPESVCIYTSGRWCEAPDVWIAVYHGELPKDIEALAPPSFGVMRQAQRGIHGSRMRIL